MVVDDHAVVRLGLRTLLADEEDLEVVAEASSADQAMTQVENLRPDVVILDIQLPGRNGIQVCQEILSRFEGTKVVMLTSHADDAFLDQSIRVGASGYVLKQVGNEELVRAIRAAHQGEMAFDTRTTSQMVNRFKQLESAVNNSAFEQLTPREIQVVSLVATGESNKQIGHELNLSEITVRNYISNIFSKLQLRNRTELATFAITHRLTEKVKE
jgi:DNA-binding NarL/FixJ family response regulator